MSNQENHDLSSFKKRSRLGHAELPRKANPEFTASPRPVEKATHVTVAPTRQAQPTSTPLASKAKGRSLGRSESVLQTPQAVPKPTPAPQPPKKIEFIRGSTESGKPMGSEGTYLKYDSSTERGAAASTGTTVGRSNRKKQRRSIPLGTSKNRQRSHK